MASTLLCDLHVSSLLRRLSQIDSANKPQLQRYRGDTEEKIISVSSVPLWLTYSGRITSNSNVSGIIFRLCPAGGGVGSNCAVAEYTVFDAASSAIVRAPRTVGTLCTTEYLSGESS